MKQLKQPSDYKIVIKNSSWFGPFGYYYSSRKLIEIYPPVWALPWFGIRKWLVGRILEHELGHTRGITGCKKPWCLMFEAKMWKEKWKDIWWERFISPFFLIFNGFDFCKEHKEYLKRYEETNI